MKVLRSKKLLIGVTGLALAFGAWTARAQDAAPSPLPPGGPGERVTVRVGPGGHAIGFMGFEAGIAGKIVTNAPFTATVSTQITRTLADGNKIDQTITGTIARDSQGRTRRDMTLPGAILASANGGPAPHAVFINDPVARTTYILHPDSKIADQMPFRAIKRGLRPVIREFSNDAGIASRRELASEITRADLGTQTINGVLAQGTRITRTIPAGQIGNERPIVIVTERWYSPELQTYVLRKTIDPLMGNTTFQLTNIQPVEPDPSLFQVPAGYTMRKGRVFRFRDGAGAPVPPAPDSQN